ncbi:MauE/DoxX family redox-associated membrane protein [Streptomyces sp. NPDC088246]|uniref:MauE/DoxX family redox-associated membrane protein n=1 Tax=Streptomyces sp. NPDC088246 TaxID=3365842 RepID=UPI003817D05B
MQYILIGARCLLGAVFLVAALGKVARDGAFDSFARSIQDTALVPARFVRPAAVTVVAAEMLVCVALALPAKHAPAVGLAGATTLLSAFTIGIALTLSRGADAHCRCFGKSDAVLRPRHLVRNATLAGLSLTALVPTVAAPSSTGEVHPAGAVVAMTAGLVGSALTVRLDDILDLFVTDSTAPSLAQR